jgi:hypothetical protein
MTGPGAEKTVDEKIAIVTSEMIVHRQKRSGHVDRVSAL